MIQSQPFLRLRLRLYITTSEEHDDHSEEHDDHDIETSIMVPQGIPDKLEVLNYELEEIIEINFISDVEKEIHIHGYDIHFMVYPDKKMF